MRWVYGRLNLKWARYGGRFSAISAFSPVLEGVSRGLWRLGDPTGGVVLGSSREFSHSGVGRGYLPTAGFREAQLTTRAAVEPPGARQYGDAPRRRELVRFWDTPGGKLR